MNHPLSSNGQSQRLAAEFETMQALAAESSILAFTAEGDPPTVYTVTLRGKGLNCRSPLAEEVEFVELHEVQIRLGHAYPQHAPEVRWLTPIFHPNISTTGHVVDDCGLPWQEELTLAAVCERLWDLARWAYVDEDQTSNHAAKKWFAVQTEVELPIDDRPLRDGGRPAFAHPLPPREDVAGGEPAALDAEQRQPEKKVLDYVAAAQPAPPFTQQPPDRKVPDYQDVHDFLHYRLSLPERCLRSASAVAGGALRESASLLVPQAFQNSKTYHVMIRQMLDFLAEDVGGVQRCAEPEATAQVEGYVARKAVGNFVEMAGLATLHLSPLLLLAVFSDVAYGSQAYLRELAEELKRQGVIDQNSTINHADDLLEAVAGTADAMAAAFDTPPLSVDGLRRTIEETREAARTVDPSKMVFQAEAQRLWDKIHATAVEQGTRPWTISCAMTLFSLDKIGSLGRGSLSTVTAAGTLLHRHVINHYEDALGNIRSKGICTVLAESSGPYIDAVWKNFSTEKTTVTEELLSGRLAGKGWSAVRRWLGGSAG